MKIKWKQNLLVAWIGCFFTGASISLVMPFIPVYVEQLGTPKSQVELFSGLQFPSRRLLLRLLHRFGEI